MFNKEFDANITYNALKVKCRNLGIVETHYPYTQITETKVYEGKAKSIPTNYF